MVDDPIDNAIEVLNRLHAADPSVMQDLVNHRVPCNDAVCDDPTVQVGIHDGEWKVGILGIINGIFGTRNDGRGGFISAMISDEGDVLYFERLEDTQPEESE